MAIPMPDFKLDDVQLEFSASSGASGGTNVFQAPQAPQWFAGTTQNKDWLTSTGGGAELPGALPRIGGVHPFIILAALGGGAWLFMRGRK